MISNGTLCAIIIFSLIFLLVGMLYEAQGEHDYFKSNVIWNQSPQVCLQNIPRGDLFLTIRAVNQWEKALKEYGKEQFNYNLKVLTGTNVTGCQIVIMKESPINNPISDINPIGLTLCYKDIIMCVIRIDDVTYGDSYYHDTIVHEMGHAIGLGHRLVYEASGFPALVMSNDIMMPTAKKHLYITRESLDALIWFYQDDNYIYNYTIPHNSTWKSLK